VREKRPRLWPAYSDHHRAPATQCALHRHPCGSRRVRGLDLTRGVARGTSHTCHSAQPRHQPSPRTLLGTARSPAAFLSVGNFSTRGRERHHKQPFSSTYPNVDKPRLESGSYLTEGSCTA